MTREDGLIERLMTTEERIAVFLGFHNSDPELSSHAKEIILFCNWNNIPAWLSYKNTGHNIRDKKDPVSSEVGDIVQDIAIELWNRYNQYNILEKRMSTFNTFANHSMPYFCRTRCQTDAQNEAQNEEDRKERQRLVNIINELSEQMDIPKEQVTIDSVIQVYTNRYRSRGKGKGLSVQRARRLLESRPAEFESLDSRMSADPDDTKTLGDVLSIEAGNVIAGGSRSEFFRNPEAFLISREADQDFYERLRYNTRNIGVGPYAYMTSESFYDEFSDLCFRVLLEVNREFIKKSMREGAKRGLPDLDDEAAVVAYRCAGQTDDQTRTQKLNKVLNHAMMQDIARRYKELSGCGDILAKKTADKIYAAIKNAYLNRSESSMMLHEETIGDDVLFKDLYDDIAQLDNDSFFSGFRAR